MTCRSRIKTPNQKKYEKLQLAVWSACKIEAVICLLPGKVELAHHQVTNVTVTTPSTWPQRLAKRPSRVGNGWKCQSSPFGEWSGHINFSKQLTYIIKKISNSSIHKCSSVKNLPILSSIKSTKIGYVCSTKNHWGPRLSVQRIVDEPTFQMHTASHGVEKPLSPKWSAPPIKRTRRWWCHREVWCSVVFADDVKIITYYFSIQVLSHQYITNSSRASIKTFILPHHVGLTFVAPNVQKESDISR